MNFFNKMLGKPQPEPSFMDDLGNQMGLSYTKRVIAFVTFFILGLLFCFLSTWMIMFPTRFAKFYTIGSIFIILSTFFLVGPKRQIQNMFHPSRAVAAALYFGSMGATLYTALSLQQTLLTLVMVSVQFAAAVWYGASYIPFAQDCLRSTAKTVLPL